LADWQAKGYKGNGFYSIEVRIPFKIFGAVTGKGDQWKANICRNTVLDNGRKGSCWSEMQISYHDEEYYGNLIFVDNPKEEGAIGRHIEQAMEQTKKQVEILKQLKGLLEEKANNADADLVMELRLFSEKSADIEKSLKESLEKNLPFEEQKEILLSSKQLTFHGNLLLRRMKLRAYLRAAGVEPQVN
jgi:hypothetical protein